MQKDTEELKKSFEELGNHKNIIELESELIKKAKHFNLKENKYRELYKLYLAANSEQLKQSFKSITSRASRLQHECEMAREAQRFGITVDEYRQLYRFSYHPIRRLFVRGSSLREKKAWDYIQLLFLPVGLAGLTCILTWWFNDQIKQRELTLQDSRHKQEAALQDSRHKQETLNKYFDSMASIAKQAKEAKEAKKTNSNEQNPDEWVFAKARTLSVLRELDDERNSQVLRFLRQTTLISGKEPLIDLNEGNLGNAKLKKAELRLVVAKFTSFNNAILEEARLDEAILTKSDFTKANLSKANLVGADLSGTKLNDANLSGADLKGADLTGADLTGADLTGADLSGARMKDAIVNSTQLEKATLCKTEIDSKISIDKNRNDNCLLGNYIVINKGVPLKIYDEPNDLKINKERSIENGTIVWVTKLKEEKYEYEKVEPSKTYSCGKNSEARCRNIAVFRWVPIEIEIKDKNERKKVFMKDSPRLVKEFWIGNKWVMKEFRIGNKWVMQDEFSILKRLGTTSP